MRHTFASHSHSSQPIRKPTLHAASARTHDTHRPPSDAMQNRPAVLDQPGVHLQHLGVIMDGNARWAQQRGLPAAVGHQQGVESLRSLVKACGEWNVPYLSVFALSTENYHQRPPKEVEYLLELFKNVLQRELTELADSGVCLKFSGQLTELPQSLQDVIHNAEANTAHLTRVHLNIALNYGGRQELTTAIRHIAQQIASGELDPDTLDETTITRHLSTSEFPSLDLLIRTGREQRLSNFLLWQSAYSELYFSDVLWPDFSRNDLAAAVTDYANRERRFGKRLL